MDFDKLKTFHFVASSGSVTKAAEKLGLSKSSVSRQLLQLETQLNTKLFNRELQKLILSPQGLILFEKTKHILLEIEAIKTAIDSAESQLKGHLKITTTHALVSLWLTEFLHLFIEKHPQIKLKIIASSHELNLSLREADVAIRPYSPNRDDLIQTHLWRWRLTLFASKIYLDRFGLPTTPEDLDQHRLIILGDSPNLYPTNYTSWPLMLGTTLGRSRTPFLVINSVQGMYNLVRNGVGIGNFSQQSPLFENNDNELIPLLSNQMYSDIDVYYIYPKQYQNLQPVIALGEFLKGYVKGLKS